MARVTFCSSLSGWIERMVLQIGNDLLAFCIDKIFKISNPCRCAFAV